MSDYVLELNDVSKTYYLGKIVVPVLKGVDLKVKKGSFISIMGPSGSGKSTLLNLMGGLDNPTSGRIVVDGVDITKMGEGDMANIRRQKIGFIFQTFNLIPVLTALENIEIPMILAGDKTPSEIREKAIDLLTLVSLKDRLDHKPGELSGGEQQRVSIARALANDPSIVLADEPTGNLDSLTGQQVIHLLRWLNEVRNQSFIIVSHNPGITALADKILYMSDGTLSSDIPELTTLPTDQLNEQKNKFLISELDSIKETILQLKKTKHAVPLESHNHLLYPLEERFLRIQALIQKTTGN